MIRDDVELREQWLKDIRKVDNGSYPQGRMVLVAERGTKEMAVLKAKERMCSAAQKECCDLTTELMQRYYEAIKSNPLPFYDDIRRIAASGFKSRCTWGYKCNQQCFNPDGIKNTRDY